MMSMVEFFEAGYEVVVQSMFGDVLVDDMDMVEAYEGAQFDHVDYDAMVVWFFDEQDYDD